MVRDKLLFIVFSFGMSAAAFFIGRKIVFTELKQTENEEICKKGRIIWTLVCITGFLGVSALFYFREATHMDRLIFLLYVFLYSSLIGIVDLFSHNYYLEMLPGLLLFIPIGCITWGLTEGIYGLVVGICIGCILAMTEWLFFNKLSYGGGDTVYGAGASALIGYSNLCLYWGIFAVLLIIAGLVHIIYVKVILRQSLEDNKFIPLLPWFSFLTVILYAILITNNQA